MREMKDSGVEWIGEIPSNKCIIRNKYLFEYVKGKLPSNTNFEQVGMPYIGASDLDSNYPYKVYTMDYELPEADEEDLLVLWDGARAGLCGTNKKGKISSTIVRIRGNNTSEVYQHFIYWYYKGFENYMYQRVNGTTIPHMNRRYIEEIQFIDWNYDEQHHIADYLDSKCSKIDAIIEREQAVIEKLKEYKLSIITEAVTKGLNPDVEKKDSGYEFIGDIPSHWKMTKFKYLSLTIGDGIHTTPNYDENGDIYFINGNNIGDNNLVFKDGTNKISEEEYSKYKLPLLTEDTIFITLNGATYGKTSFYNGEKVLLGKSAGYITFIPTQNKEYLRYYLQSNTAKLIMDLSLLGSTIANVSLRTLNNFVIPYPTFEEQKVIVDYLNARCSLLDKNIIKKQSVIDKLTEYKKSLIYEVVTGKKEV